MSSTFLRTQTYSRRWPAVSVAVAVALAAIICFAYLKWLEPRMANHHLAIGHQKVNVGISGHRGLIDDEVQYLSIAKNISAGEGYGMFPGEPSAVRLPAYPFYVAALFHLFGSSIEVALLGNAFLVVLLPLLTLALAIPAFGVETAVTATFFCALDPGIYYFGLSQAYAEALFAVVLCAAIVMWQHGQSPGVPQETTPFGELAGPKVANSAVSGEPGTPQTRSYFFILAAGILFGIASLVRTGMIFLPLFIVLIEFLIRRRNFSFKKAAVFCVASVLIIFPWALRNHQVLGAWIFSSTNDGVTLLGSALAARQNRGDWVNPGTVDPEYARLQRLPDSIDRDRSQKQAAIVELKKISPATWIQVVVKRVFRLWIPLNRIVSDEVGRIANLVVNLFYFPAMLLAVFGLWRARHCPMVIAIWTTCLYLTLLAAVSWGSTRFRYGAESFLAIFAAYGLLEAKKILALRFSSISTRT